MEIRVTRSEFLGELAPMQGIVERKTTIPVLSHLLLTAREDRLHLAATDLDVSLTSWCESDIKREGGIAVQAKKLMEIIRSLTGEEVLLVQEEPRVLTIRAGKSRFFCTISTEYMTVEWCLSLKSLPISGKESSVSFLQRYIATWRGMTICRELLLLFISETLRS